MTHTIHNDKITVEISSLGAELQSIRSAEREYLWHGDAQYWNRRSPILFPFVGSVWDKEYHHQGTTYAMGQHGFARDMEFGVVSHTDEEILLAVESTPDTLKKYPFPFRLEIGYRLEGQTLRVQWNVSNPGTEEMHFQIGAHPAFLWDDSHATERGSMLFDNAGPILGTLLDEKGCIHANPQYFSQPLQAAEKRGYGVLPLTKDYFYPIDTLVLEHNQVHHIVLRDNAERPIVGIRYAAPVVGIWTPTDLDAPFVCLEPWYGRCDRAHNTGEMAHNDWMNHLPAGGTFTTHYDIDLY